MPDQLRRQVLDLRRAHSLSQVAEMTALPLGTVKTICSRSGEFRDNPKHRELFSLPPLKLSASTDLAVPELPPQEDVTGDKEVDALLWLRSVISTGQAAMIEKAMLGASRIKTPLAELEKRYASHMMAKHPGSLSAVFASIGFADLEDLAKRCVKKLSRKQEARARFGDDLFESTQAEQFCIEALEGLERGTGWTFDRVKVDTRFVARADLMPHTLSDCLYELDYWDCLYKMRAAVDGTGDPAAESTERERFAFRRLAHIRAKTKDEAIAVFRYLSDSEYMDETETNDILLNLIG
ncbi:hypothetical protein HAV38_04365 [Glaciimonas immobilis]|nr:hypothetical protein HAV38_04365 [Glaciimonas immobilis]